MFEPTLESCRLWPQLGWCQTPVACSVKGSRHPFSRVFCIQHKSRWGPPSRAKLRPDLHAIEDEQVCSVFWTLASVACAPSKRNPALHSSAR